MNNFISQRNMNYNYCLTIQLPTHCKWDIVKRIFEVQNVDPNFSDQETFLYLAFINGEIEMVEFFLKLDGIDVNKYEYKSGKTPLIGTIMNDKRKIAEILISNPKTNINCRDYEKTPFNHGCRK